jgi:cobalamin biosynthesis protein CbiD
LAAASDSAPKVLLGRSSSELSAAVADLAGAALLITLLGVLIKITLRQFNTHSHLSLEAAERITFTKTYLALLNEGKLKSDEDRKLILESLFRSTQSGSVAEIPFSSPIELILKTLGEKKVA